MSQPVRQRKPITSPWALVYLLLALQVSVMLPGFTGANSVNIAGYFFMPILAFWLGARFGKAALTPLWLCAMLIIPWFTWQMTDTVRVTFGVGPQYFALTVAATLAGARDRSGAWNASSKTHLVFDLALLVVLALASGSVGAGVSSFQVYLDSSTDSMSTALLILVVAGRLGLVPALAVTLVAAAGLWTAGALHLPLSGEARSGSYDTPFASVGWSWHPFDLLVRGAGAAFVGALLRRVWLDRHAAALVLHRSLAAVTLLVLILLPALAALADAGLHALMTPPPAPLATGDQVEIVARTDFPYFGLYPDLNTVTMIGAAAFAIAFSSRRPRILLTAATIELLVLASLIIAEFVYPYREESLPVVAGAIATRIDGVAAFGIVAFIYAWYGGLLRFDAPREQPA